MAIHVSGAAQNVALVRGDSVEILDSEITAVGQDSTGISNLGPGPPDLGTHVTLERSLVSAETAIHEEWGGSGTGTVLRMIDSRVFGTVFFNPEFSPLEIVGSEIVGTVTAGNDAVRVTITNSSIKGGVARADTTSGLPIQAWTASLGSRKE